MSMGNLEIGVCDDSLEDLKRIQIAQSCGEIRGERIHLHSFI